jgi:hypothetical protein
MLRNSRVGTGSSKRQQPLSTSRRTADVEKLQQAIGGFTADASVVNNCAISLFEIVGDEYIHCNVTHQHLTKTVTGWAGPGHVAQGFVHNRRFADMPHRAMVRHIREMVFAERV